MPFDACMYNEMKTQFSYGPICFCYLNITQCIVGSFITLESKQNCKTRKTLYETAARLASAHLVITGQLFSTGGYYLVLDLMQCAVEAELSYNAQPSLQQQQKTSKTEGGTSFFFSLIDKLTK